MYCGQHKKEVRAAGSHRIRVQGTQETDAFSFDWCRQRATFAPWGFVDRGALLISSFEYYSKLFEQGGKKIILKEELQKNAEKSLIMLISAHVNKLID